MKSLIAAAAVVLALVFAGQSQAHHFHSNVGVAYGVNGGFISTPGYGYGVGVGGFYPGQVGGFYSGPVGVPFNPYSVGVGAYLTPGVQVGGYFGPQVNVTPGFFGTRVHVGHVHIIR